MQSQNRKERKVHSSMHSAALIHTTRFEEETQTKTSKKHDLQTMAELEGYHRGLDD